MQGFFFDRFLWGPLLLALLLLEIVNRLLFGRGLRYVLRDLFFRSGKFGYHRILEASFKLAR